MTGLPWAYRFWLNVTEDTETRCLNWTGFIDADGYGRFGIGDQRLRAHRIAYTLVRSERVPDDLELDHLCRNRRCVNPDHLEVVTKLENWRRGESITRRNADVTECPKGHPYDAANTRVTYRQGRPIRFCRACNREASARHRARQAAAS